MNSDSPTSKKPDSPPWHSPLVEEGGSEVDANSGDRNPVLPEDELENVLTFLNRTVSEDEVDTVPHFISSLVNHSHQDYHQQDNYHQQENYQQNKQEEPEFVSSNFLTVSLPSSQPLNTIETIESKKSGEINETSKPEITKSENNNEEISKPIGDSQNTDSEPAYLVISKTYDSGVPESMVSESMVSESMVSESMVSENVVSESAVPESMVSENGVLDIVNHQSIPNSSSQSQSQIQNNIPSNHQPENIPPQNDTISNSASTSGANSAVNPIPHTSQENIVTSTATPSTNPPEQKSPPEVPPNPDPRPESINPESINLESVVIEIHPNLQVQFKTEAGKLQVILPSEAQVASSKYSWSEIWQQFKVRLSASDRLLVANSGVHLDARDRLLDGRQLQELAETFTSVNLHLESIATSRRQTAIAAVTAGYSVQQTPAHDPLRSLKETTSALADPIYLETTVRSGVEIRHPGTVIILGDVNPGGIIVADGDILIWGRLRGVAHAGAGGNRECLIMALQMEPTQLRIADTVARAPEKSPRQFHAEVAHVANDAIRISRAADFSRAQFLNRIDPGKFGSN